jgi:tetratricopeptide (TPR) repeat protein
MVLNTIDYYLAGELNPVYFHVSIFFWYIVQCVLMYLLFLKIINSSITHRWNNYFALFITAYYALHTANAETINYIISRSDSFSTLCIVAGLLFYINPATRKFQLHILSMIVAMLTKQTGLMFIPILFSYVFIFEEDLTLTKVFRLSGGRRLGKVVVKVLPAALVGFGLFILIQKEFSMSGELLGATPINRWVYFMNQQFVVLRYIGNFLIPLGLSADNTVTLTHDFFEQKIIYGILVHASLITIAILAMKKQHLKPVSFGILWFYFALIPTSTIIPLGQISNDHRIFFPYIGLCLSLGWAIVLLILKYEDKIKSFKFGFEKIAVSAIIIILLYGFGAYKRNQVWSSSEKLWEDAARKGPNNGRALMNYGVALMSKGNLAEATEYFDRAEYLLPSWSFVHINQGVLKWTTGEKEEAEQHFKKAIMYQPSNPESYYFYAWNLFKDNRRDEAIQNLKAGLQQSPGHVKSKNLLSQIESGMPAPGGAYTSQQVMVSNYINLSLSLYNSAKYRESIEMAEKALELEPDNANAYNNICASYCSLKEWDEAINACSKALQIDPDFQRAKNNLQWARSGKSGEE